MLKRFYLIFLCGVFFFFLAVLPALAEPRPNPDSIPFAPAVNYPAGDTPYSVFCADLDGDGDLDLAVANGNSNNVSILKNNGDGTFQTKVDYSVGEVLGDPNSVFCADLDGDLDLDLAVANSGSQNVSILKNNGDGTFQTRVNYWVGNFPSSVFCADLDGDTDKDLAVANANSNNVSILKNNGDGTFQAKVDYGAGDYSHSVFCADLDGDTDLDLAVANQGSGYVSILKNNGNGTFQTKVVYFAGDAPWSVFCADLDGDTDLDLAVANAGNYKVSILKNNGDGTFQAKVDYDPGWVPQSVFCADLDGDTDLDLAVANWSSDNVSILKNLTAYFPDTLKIIAFCPIHMIITAPNGDSISPWFNTITSADYDTLHDWNGDSELDDSVTIPNPLVGEYQIRVLSKESGKYSIGVRIDGTDMSLLSDSVEAPPPGETDTVTYDVLPYLRGDVNKDNTTDIGDIVFEINYVFYGGEEPYPIELGDCNCDGVVDIGDIVHLINYVFYSGTPPCS